MFDTNLTNPHKREKTHMNHILKSIALLTLASGIASADTTQTGPSVFEVDAGVTFSLSNFAASDYLFNWADGSGSFANVADPTLILTAGETYTFLNQTSTHPFIITDTTLPVVGTDGDYTRTTSDITVMNAATVDPIADFTSDPGGSDPVVWTPSPENIGDYFYTCRITGHASMTGRIQVVAGAAPCIADLTDVSAFLNAFTSMDPIADFTNDGNFNFFDVSAFLNAFTAGCP